MNSSNSFNICPRCGNANALSAKYCSRCGGQLKVPEEPVVCHKCHTRNTPMANFCRNCGVELKVGLETKICPKCGKEVDAGDSICVCGYSFVTLQETLPAKNAVRVADEADSETPSVKTTQKTKDVYNTKGGRGWAIAALVLLLLFAYYIITPYASFSEKGDVLVVFRPEFLVNLDGGFINRGDTVNTIYGYGYIYELVNIIKSVADGGSFSEIVEMLGMGNMMIMAVTVAFIVAALAHLIVCITRICTGKRSKRANWTYLVLAVITTLVIGLITLFYYVQLPEVMSIITNLFAIGGANLGVAVWAIPVYFWFFFLYSLCAKAKKLQEHVA